MTFEKVPISRSDKIPNRCGSRKFKMEALEAVRKLIQPGDFMMKLDLQDAYFSVPMHNSHKKYLRFVFQRITYEFQCLPFGLSSAPRTFTKLLKPVIVLLRTQGIRIVIYLDDMLILDQSPNVNLLQRLGFLIKQEKYSQAPSLCLEFLGSLINSREMTQANEPLLPSKNAATYWSADGQLYSSCICQQERGNQVFNFSSLGSRDLERLSTERNMDNSTTPSGSTECRCGLGFSSLQRTHRVDSGQGDLRTYSHKVLHSTSRLVCISAQSSTTPLCFPAPRPGCNGGRCNDIAMEQMDIVHSCANCNASPHSEEDTRRSGNLSTHCPELAGPDMVSATIGDVGGNPR
ncbi:Hypothetical predicted protein, partial [Paramuricea clavata]